MFWEKSELDAAITSNDQRLRNFFDVFGFIVIRGFLPKRDWWKLFREYDRQYDLRTGKKPWWKRLTGMRFLPNFVDSSEIFTNYFFSEGMQKVYRYFAGDDFLYLGSDGSHFMTTSFPWHRDWFTKMPIMKFNFYFNPLPFFGGKFMLIPGSNQTQDTYAGSLQKSMSWPMQNKQTGGLSENSFLPPTVNPRRSLWNRFFKPNYPDVPHVEIKLGRGDLIIFDHRSIHCVQDNFPRCSRRLLTILLSRNAFSFSDEHYLVKAGHKRDDLMREIIDLAISERNHIGCPAWGEFIYKHPFSQSKNFIDIAKIGTHTESDKLTYNSGAFLRQDDRDAWCFTSSLDVERYAAIGKTYRQKIGDASGSPDSSQSYSYGDVHLGINAQNIRKIFHV